MNNFDILSKLHAECFPGKPWSAGDFADLKKSGCEIIASDNAFIVWRIAADQAEIITVGVKPGARHQGLAAAMFAIMEKELSKQNVGKIFLEVAVDNAPAIALYSKHGFVQAGIRPKYYDGKDAVILAKKLA